MQVIVESTADEAAVRAAALLAECIHDTDRPCTFGLAGGATPVAAYRQLRNSSLVDWEKVVCWLPDERFVPPDHDDSNSLMARRELTDHVPTTLVAPDTTVDDPHLAAAGYATELATILYEGRPDLLLLGMGDDGHTASLFPGTAALAEREEGYVANWVDRLDCWRLTATLPLLQAARRVVFLVTGDHKAEMLRRVVADGEPYPARLVAEGGPEVRWVTDEAAASRL